MTSQTKNISPERPNLILNATFSSSLRTPKSPFISLDPLKKTQETFGAFDSSSSEHKPRRPKSGQVQSKITPGADKIQLKPISIHRKGAPSYIVKALSDPNKTKLRSDIRHSSKQYNRNEDSSGTKNIISQSLSLKPSQLSECLNSVQHAPETEKFLSSSRNFGTPCFGTTLAQNIMPASSEKKRKMLSYAEDSLNNSKSTYMHDSAHFNRNSLTTSENISIQNKENINPNVHNFTLSLSLEESLDTRSSLLEMNRLMEYNNSLLGLSGCRRSIRTPSSANGMSRRALMESFSSQKKLQQAKDVRVRESLESIKSFEDEGKRLKEVVEKVNQENKETRISLYKFKFEKLTNKLEKIFGRAYKEPFDLMSEIMQEERLKEAKVDVLRGLKMKSQSFCLWVAYLQDQKFEKEKQELEKQKELQEKQWNRACEFYNEHLLKKSFYQGLCQFFCNIHPDRKAEMDQNRVKTAVNRFMIKINSKKSLVEEETQDQPPKEEMTTVESQVFLDEEIEEEIPEEIEVIEDDDVIISGTEEKSGEKDQESTVSGEKSDSIGSKQTVPEQPKKGETFKEKVKKLEERALRRKDSLSLIRKKHEEQKAQKQPEIKKKLSQRKSINQKAQAQAQEPEEEQEDLQLLEKAFEFRTKSLLERYGLRLIQKLSRWIKNRARLAEMFHKDQVKQRVLEAWGQALALIEVEKVLELAPKIREVERKHQERLKRRVFKVLGNSKEKISSAEEYYKMTLKRKAMNIWKGKLLDLMKENVKEEKFNQEIIEPFRSVWLKKRGFNGLKGNMSQTLKDKMRRRHKDLMWGKVTGWLQEYQSKRETTGSS